MKSIIKVSLKALGFVALMVISSANATDISLDGTKVWVDDRFDAGEGGWNYNIDGMTVSWEADNTISVNVFTNFAKQRTTDNGYSYNANNIYSDSAGNSNKIIFGDLLIGANSTGNSGYNYAYSLGSLSGSGDRYSHKNKNSESGGLFAISGTQSAGQFHGYKDTNGDTFDKGAVFGNTVNDELENSSNYWSTSNWTSSNGRTYGKLSFSFNVAGIELFQKADSLSLSWAMSCFNDNVSRTFTVNRPNTAVPEPGTMVLMLLALAGLVYRQKKISNNFSA